MKKRLISMICLICLFFTGLCGKNPFNTSHTITYDCSVSSTVKGEATCISKGTTTYTASYGSGKNKITDTKDVKDIPVNPDNHANEIEIKGNKEATCGEEGYTGDTFCKDCGSRIQKGIVIEKKKHNYKNPVFNWTDDKKRAIVMFICSNNVDHTITYECTVTSVVTAYATCTTKGITTYTASYGEGENKVTEVKEVQDCSVVKRVDTFLNTIFRKDRITPAFPCRTHLFHLVYNY